ncbi:hypothetical protein GCM10022267_74890 [Lentzea roselyniae]|uniref:Uncharacterized protein n=1 Tax=Lentzea roselyniae TaxID=531940 RepID=A0ABP7C5E5_9PSEU
MDERELRTAMDDAVAVAPPPMMEGPVLVAGRQALKRRRALRASTASAAVVAITAVGVAVLASGQGHNGFAPVGAKPSAVPDTVASSPTARPDATATSGPHHDRAAALAAALSDLAPDGFGTPDDLKGTGDFANRPLKSHKAMSAGAVNGTELWQYAAGTPLTKGAAVGELVATVHSPGSATTGEGCGLKPTAWDSSLAHCTEVNVSGKTVAVASVTYPAVDGLPPAQWAGYRHADGTVVFVMQSTGMARSGRPALAAMPMTDQQLAALAVDPRLSPR